MVGDRKQCVGVWRQIHARHARALIGHEIDESGILMREAVVILPPDGGRQQDVLRRDGGAPMHVVLGDVQPFRVLVEHRIDHVGERFVGVEEPVTPGEQVTFEPAEQRVLGQHLHHAAIGRKLAAVGVFGQHVREPGLLARFVDRLQPVGRGLVRAEHAERGRIVAQDVAQELAERLGVLVQHLAGFRHLHGVVAEVRQRERLAQQPAIGMRIRAHAAGAFRRERFEFGPQRAGRVEELFVPVAAHPVFEQFQMRRVVLHVGEWHLVRSPRALSFVALDLLGSGPAFRRPEHDHRPARSERRLRRSRLLLQRPDFADRHFQRRRHRLVHHVRIAAFDEVRLVAVADKQRFELLVADAREDRRVGNLVAVQVEDRQNRAVAHRVDELVRVPCRGERPCLRFAVADDAGDDQIGVVERHSIRVREAVAEFAAFVDRAGRLRRDVRSDLSGEGELLEELPQAFRVLALVRIHLRVRALEVRGPEHPRRAVARAGHEDHVQVVLDDHPVQMRPHERQRRARAPVSQEPELDVFDRQRFPEQRVVAQIDHAD